MSLQHIIFDTLYSRSSTNKLLEWVIEVERNRYRTISGEAQGSKVTSNWTTCFPKNVGRSNETTGEEQALREAEAKHTKKLEKGYSKDTATAGKMEFFSPMLAHKFKDHSAKISFPCYSQPKLDGVRCIITEEGMFSRNGKPIVACPHILYAVEHLLDDYILDGELYNHDLKNDFNQIISLVKKRNISAKDLLEAKKKIKFYLFDRVSIADKNQLFSERLDYMNWDLDECIVKVPTICVEKKDSSETMDKIYRDYLEDGYEGQIIRNDSPYQKKRSYNLLKRKEFQDEEFLILDVIEGIGNRAGMAGKLLLLADNKETFEAGIRGNFSTFEMMLKDKHDIIGLDATVRYQNLTPAGIPRFPVCVGIRDYE